MDDSTVEIIQTSSRGPTYTPFKDLLICKAFLSALENSFLGANMRDEAFCIAMHDKYCALIVEEEMKHSNAIQNLQPISRLIVHNAAYTPRSEQAIYARWRDYINPQVSKFVGIEATVVQKSGTDAKQHLEM